MADSTSANAAGDRIDLPQPLAPQQVCDYVEQGFLVVPQLLEASAVEELRGETVRIARGEYPCPSLVPLPASMPDDEVLRRILAIHHPQRISPVVQRYIRDPGICGALAQITAAHLPYWDGSVKCMQSMLFVKPPGFQGQAWHQDEIHIPTRDRSLVGAWIALDRATTENGGLRVLPESHRRGYLYPLRDHGRPDEFDGNQESHGFDGSREMPVEVDAGDVVFFNGYLLHRSLKNRSDVYRRTLVNHYMNAWSLLPWHARDAQRGDRAAQADARCVIPVAGVDPYAWKGYEAGGQDVLLRRCEASEGPRTDAGNHRASDESD